MARIRSIWPSICQSQDMANLPAHLERTYVRLWTHCDDEGRAVDNPRLIKAALYPLNDEQTWEVVDRELSDLERQGLIGRYEVDGVRYLAVLAWDKYQRPQKKVQSKVPPLPEGYATPTGVVPAASANGKGLDLGDGDGVGNGIAPVLRSRSRTTNEDGQLDRDGIWTALEDQFGKATTRTGRNLRGKLVKSLAEAGATYTSVKERSAAWPKLFPGRNGQPPPDVYRHGVGKVVGRVGVDRRNRQASPTVPDLRFPPCGRGDRGRRGREGGRSAGSDVGAVQLREGAMTYLYRFFDRSGRLLYVGMSYRIDKRLASHRVAKPWDQIARIEIEQFPTRGEAVSAEREAILSEAPSWNVVYVPLEFPA